MGTFTECSRPGEMNRGPVRRSGYMTPVPVGDESTLVILQPGTTVFAGGFYWELTTEVTVRVFEREPENAHNHRRCYDRNGIFQFWIQAYWPEEV